MSLNILGCHVLLGYIIGCAPYFNGNDKLKGMSSGEGQICLVLYTIEEIFCMLIGEELRHFSLL